MSAIRGYVKTSAVPFVALLLTLLMGCNTVDDTAPGTFDAIVHGQVVSADGEKDFSLYDLRGGVYSRPGCESDELDLRQAGPIGPGERFEYLVYEFTEETIQCISVQVTYLYGNGEARRVGDTTVEANLELRREPPLDSLKVIVEVDLDGEEE